MCEDLEKFNISLTSMNDNCAIDAPYIPVYIIDDGECLPLRYACLLYSFEINCKNHFTEDCCDPDPCDENAICDELPGPDNYTCMCMPGYVGDGISCRRKSIS